MILITGASVGLMLWGLEHILWNHGFTDDLYEGKLEMPEQTDNNVLLLRTAYKENRVLRKENQKLIQALTHCKCKLHSSQQF